MLPTVCMPRADDRQRKPSAEIGEWNFDDVSPFGLQGIERESLRILKPECIGRLAATLAIRGTRQQIRDGAFVAGILNSHEDWHHEYRVVHLIERSLWINGRSDLVMTLTRNPSQIPDNPPRQIMEALSHAHRIHPQATIWYGVPLFGDQMNEQGLPIPLTAVQIQEEAQNRVRAAQQHALRWGWFYRLILKTANIPSICCTAGKSVALQIKLRAQREIQQCQQAQRDARRRYKAAIVAQLEYCRTGRSRTVIPEHTTRLGRAAQQGLESMNFAQELLALFAPSVTAVTGAVTLPLLMAKLVLIVPLTIVAADPFLFVELPDEPGKLRHLGHWYWQAQSFGRRKLHLHT